MAGPAQSDFYICQSSCLCRTVRGRGKVVYCWGDLLPLHGDRLVGCHIYRRHAVLTKGVNRFGSEGEGGEGRGLATLLTAQTAVWLVGLLALLAARLVTFLPS